MCDYFIPFRMKVTYKIILYSACRPVGLLIPLFSTFIWRREQSALSDCKCKQQAFTAKRVQVDTLLSSSHLHYWIQEFTHGYGDNAIKLMGSFQT